MPPDFEPTDVQFPEWSPKQLEVYRTIVTCHEVDSIDVVGPTQSGKSISTVYAFATWMSISAGQAFIIGSHSQRQLDRAVLRHLKEWAEIIEGRTGQRVRLEPQGSEFKLTSLCTAIEDPDDNILIPVLGSNRGSEGRARSFDALGTLADEATLWPDGVLAQLVARGSRPGAKHIRITNPAGPLHPIKQRIDRFAARPIRHYRHIPFELADNPTLTLRYRQQIEDSFIGAEKDRMVYGKWTANEGAIYPSLEDSIVDHLPAARPRYYTASGDYGGSNPTVIALWAHYFIGGKHLSIGVREWYHDGQQKGHLKAAEQARRIRRELFSGLDAPLTQVTIDRTALELITELKRFKVPVVPAGNTPGTLYDSIQVTRAYLEHGLMLLLREGLPQIIGSLSDYIWDPNNLSGDVPLKRNEHGADAVRYEAWQRGGEQSHRERLQRPERIRF